LLVSLHNKAEVETFVRQNPLLHLFELGDLDDFFWPYTIWFAYQPADTIQQIALLYTALATPVLLANPDPPAEQMRDLLQQLLPLLPRRVYAHLHPAHLDVLTPACAVQPRGLHLKMGLQDRTELAVNGWSDVSVLTEADLPALETLYQESYPDTVFSARMVQTGWYYGIRQGHALVSVAGVHVYSAVYKVAALGNVTTHPRVRGRGLARRVCARLCHDLLQNGIEQIGLNVKADNASAIRLYRGLGFVEIAEFGAYLLEWNG
jgi:ribosomal protein S18 acetylase RimI-like enzyme